MNGYTTKKRDQIPLIQPELNHTTIGALANTVDDYDFVIHPGDFAYADDWFYNYNNTYTFADEPNVYESIIEVSLPKLLMVSFPRPASDDCSRTSTSNWRQSPAASHTWHPQATTRLCVSSKVALMSYAQWVRRISPTSGLVSAASVRNPSHPSRRTRLQSSLQRRPMNSLSRPCGIHLSMGWLT